MDFSLTDTQQEIKNLAEKILSEQATPDKQKAIEKQGERFDMGLWQTLSEAGLLGVAIDEAYGGMGLGYSELAILIEEVGRNIAPVPVVPVLVSAALTLQRFASETQKQMWLPAIVSGEALLSAALMEKGNENPAEPQTTAQLMDDDTWQLSGTKLCVPLAHHAQRVLLSARVVDGKGSAGTNKNNTEKFKTALFLVDPQSKNVRLTALENTAKEPQFMLEMDAVSVHAEDVISLDAATAIEWMSQRTSIAYCAMLTGICDKAMRMTASYTAEREQFGVPVATFQAVGHRAANSYIDVYCQRVVTQQAVSLLNNELRADDEVHMAKIWTGDCGHRVSFASQHMHGGVGVDKDYPLWRYCIWARHIEMILGSSSQHYAQLGSRIAQGRSRVS